MNRDFRLYPTGGFSIQGVRVVGRGKAVCSMN
jgi:hypothetical protein